MIELLANLQSLPLSRELSVLAILLAVPCLLSAVWKWHQYLFQYFCYFMFRILYRLRITGRENWPEGGAVIVANHSTWIDGYMVMIAVPGCTRAIASLGNFNNPFLKWLAWYTGVILITGGPKSLRRGIQTAREALMDGEMVGIFPEGGITRTCQIQSFRPGVLKLLDGVDVPVIPMYIDQSWGSFYSYSGGKAGLKRLDRFRRAFTINVGKPLENPQSLHEIRQALQELGARCVSERQPPFVAPAKSFVRSCKRRKFRFKVADSAGTEITGGSLLMRSLIARRMLNKHVLDADEQQVGVLIPPSVGGVVTNMALALDRRVAVNLNYTVSNAIMNECIRKAGIKHVLTSRKVMEKFDFDFDCEVVYLDDLREKITLLQKLAGIIGAYLTTRLVLEALLGLGKCQKDDVLTIIFTSGSTGVPKGVMLTNENIATNVEAIDQVVKLNSQDTLIGILPFFHSFGYTVTLWGTMSLDIAAAYHFSPLDSQQVGKLCQKYNVSILLSTPTFLRSYMRKCTPEQFHNLDVVVAGAEKLPVEICDAFEKKFGVRPIEGYGATELSPLVSVNVPPSRRGDNYMVDCKEGTVGRPVPNVAAKITDVDTGEVLGANEEGNLWITGPNVMKGYLNEPEKTGEVIQDGWYDTGDMALIDDDGFVKITGRLSRFSKIGGEMVPHLIIEDTLSGLLDEDEQDELRVAVTAVPDPRKGERLIVLHTELRKSPADYCQGLSDAGLPNLFIPAANCFFQVDELPLLGTGKLDLRAMKQQALDMASDKAK
ncbi:MAG: AMP-binding protein [Pirellulaceae bacterium]